MPDWTVPSLVDPRPAPVDAKPSRLNFASVCIWCGERWCNQELCIARHDCSVWMVCDMCEGFAPAAADCVCVFGLTERDPGPVSPHATRLLSRLCPEDIAEQEAEAG